MTDYGKNNFKIIVNSQNNQFKPSGSPAGDIIESYRSKDKNQMLNNFQDIM